jgi:hypothetical protein
MIQTQQINKNIQLHLKSVQEHKAAIAKQKQFEEILQVGINIFTIWQGTNTYLLLNGIYSEV